MIKTTLGIEMVGNLLVMVVSLLTPLRAPLALVCTFSVMKTEDKRAERELNRFQRQERVRRQAWRKKKTRQPIAVIF